MRKPISTEPFSAANNAQATDVKHLKPDGGIVELHSDEVLIRNLSVDGSAFEAVKEAAHRGHSLVQTVQQMLHIGGGILMHGANQATVDSVSAEVDRLIAELATVASETVPTTLKDHSEALNKLLNEHFGSKNTASVQEQLKRLMAQGAQAQREEVVAALSAKEGPLARLRTELQARLSVIDSRQDHIVKEVTTLTERIMASAALKQERERGTAKGLDFEELVSTSAERFFSPYEDTVLEVGTELGADGNKAGDIVAILNPDTTGGRDVRVVIEAKCRKLSASACLKELERAMSNREAEAGVIVFDDPNHAPTKGQSLRIYPGNRVVAVLDRESSSELAMEAACHLARTLALCSLREEPAGVDTQVIADNLHRLVAILDEAKSISRGVNAARKGLDQVDGGYQTLRLDALAAIEGISSELL